MTSPFTLEDAVDPECGIITSVEEYSPHPGDPDSYVAFTTRVARTARIAPWHADPVSLGTTFGDPVAARAAAIGEALERYCGNFVPERAVERATIAELRKADRRFLDPRETVLFANHQYAQPGFPCRRVDDSLPLLWTTASDIDGPLLVPGSLVWVNWWDGPRRREPRTNAVPLAGLAAGPSRPAAIASAALEVIERDAVALWWHAGRPARRIATSCLDEELRGLDPRLEIELLDLPSETGVPVVVAILEDRHTGRVLLGAAARPSRLAAARKATLEALHMRRIADGLADPQGPHWTAVRAGEVAAGITRPYRADRHYLDDFAPDFHDVKDLGQHGLILLDPRYRDLWEPRIAARRDSAPALVLDRPGDPADHAADPVTALEQHGFQVVVADLTTPDVALLGVHVVRVLVPGMVPNAPAGLSHLGSDRFGVPSTDLDITPMPHV